MSTPDEDLLERDQTNIPLGDHELACYRETGVSLYDGNPFIEALPPILDMGQVIERLRNDPPYRESERALGPHIRVQCITTATQFFQPLPRHVDLEQRISRMIRTGYLDRNPTDPKYWAKIGIQVEGMPPTIQERRSSSDTERRFRYRPTSSGFSVVGIPGTGKTTAIEENLRLYPQVITHQKYKGTSLPVAQVVWLMIGCPYHGSLSELCKNFFWALDLALGQDPDKGYFRLYTKGSPGIDTMTRNMANLAGRHGLGVLVVDEIQHLSTAGVGSEHMLGFFVTLSNALSLPILTVGTSKALPILGGDLRQIRRSSGQGDLIWEPMDYDPKWDKEWPQEWDVFTESLWEYQYTKIPTPLTPELSACLHEVTYGIPDFAIKIYMLAQVRAITTGGELITEDIIRSVAHDSLRLAAPVLKALRERNWTALNRYPDVRPIHLDNEIRRLRTTPVDAAPSTKFGKPTLPTSGGVPSPRTPEEDLKSEAAAKKVNQKIGKIAKATNSLVALCAAATKERIAPYAALKAAGYIRDAAEFLGAPNI